MFKPVKMVRVILQVLHSDVAKVTHIIAKQGLLHLLDSQQFSKSRSVGKAGGEEFQNIMNRYTLLEQELQTMLARLSITRKFKEDIEVEPAKEIEESEEAVNRIRKDLKTLSEQLERIDKQREDKEQQLALLRSIAAAGPDLDTIRKFTYFYKTVGFITTANISRLKASLASIRYILVTLTTVERRTLVAVLCSQKDKEMLNRALTSAYFESVKLPDFSQGTLGEIIDKLESEIAQLSEKKSQLSQKLHDTQLDIVEEIQVLMEKVSLALLIMKAELFYGKGARSYIITGWIPKKEIQKFREEIMRITEGRAHLEISEPELIEEVQRDTIKIPILFNNPFLIRPFESLVFNYGIQEYKELDPTPFFAVSFLLMFGMMFGDIGHGLVLFLIGYWVFKKFYQFMDYGIITMECGVSSAIFGLLYGSIFGVEHWIPALWFHPAEDIGYFMKVALGLGVIVVSTGVIINIINSFRCKNYEDGILGHYGIVGGLFYWIAVGLGLQYSIRGHLGMSTEVLILLLAVPLGVLFFRAPLGHLLFKHGEGRKIFSSGIGIFVMEAVVDIMDVIIRYLGSTVSFIRTAAFALAHGGLFIAIFSMAEVLEQLKGGGLWYWIVIILGNVFVIALEGLVVSIQTIRLEYYEFFSKFFKGGGEKFQPLRIE